MASGQDEQAGVIEVRIGTLSQLFNSLDPSPFRERDLDHNAEAHIVGWAQELPRDVPITIVVHLPGRNANAAHQRNLETALSNYFQERAAQRDRDMRELFRSGWTYLSIGLPVLLVCLITSQFVSTGLGTGAVARTIEESLIIVGWVANWKPIETFLYDWWPIKRQRDLYVRLKTAKVEVREI